MYKHILTLFTFFLIINSSSAQTSKTAIQYNDEGVALQNQYKYTEALAAFKNAIYKNPDYKEALYNAGWTCNELKKYNESVPFLIKAKTVWPNEPKVYLELGYAYEKLDKINDALSSYEKCLSIKSDYELAFKYLGSLYYDDKNYKNALKNLKSYLYYVPDSKDDDLYFRKAVSENETGNYKDALVSIKKADALRPNNTKFINELAYTYHMLKDNEEALKLYKKSLVLDPRNVRANYWAGWCYNDLGKYKEAIPFLKKAIEVDDKYVSAYTELGYCDFALKNYDDALESFKKAFAIEKTALTMYYTGLCFVGKKDNSAALKILKALEPMDTEYAKDLRDAINKM